jgi:putative flippase GtrA
VTTESTATRTGQPARTGRRSGFLRLARFAVASGFASLTSSIAFALAYRYADAGPAAASFAAFASGATVSFAVSRFWAWERRGGDVGRDAAAFFGVAFVIAILAAGATTVTERWAIGAGYGPGPRTVLVGAAYFATYGMMFFVKFVILDKVIFKAPPA